MTRTILFALLVVMVAAGCQSSQRRDTRATRDIDVEGIDVTRLRSDLYDFLDEAAAEIAGATGDIAAASNDRKIRELALRWRIRAISALEEAVYEEYDIRRSFVEALAIIVRVRIYFSEDGRGRTIFGEQQPLIIAAAQRLEERLVELGLRHADDERVLSLQESIEDIAEEQILRERGGTTRIEFTTMSEVEESGAVSDMLGLPLAPVRGLEGVGSTPEAVNRIALVVAVMTEVIERIPQRTRWQFELMALEIESSPTVVALRTEMERLSANFERITESVQTMPADVRAEFETALTATDDAQATLRTTLQEVQQVSMSTGETVDKIDRTLASVGTATEHIRDAAEASESLIARIQEMQGDAPPDEEREPLDLDQLATMTERLSTTVIELRGLVDDLDAPLSQDSGVKQVLASADESMTAAIDRLFWRGLVLVAVIFVLAGGYRLLFRRAASG
ncbi:MAG: hypothetical protein ACYTGG_03110 [Planctomycetota bacterium]|jgi:methyl-accepting chemotaxis protein